MGGRLPHLPRATAASSADELRAGRNEPFAETAVDGIPISDKLATFAGDNDMPSCAPPIDLALRALDRIGVSAVSARDRALASDRDQVWRSVP